MKHLLDKFKFCPACGSQHFHVNNEKSKKCEDCGFEYYMNPSAANVALILNEKNELLVERRLKNPAKGTLDLPGGFTDADETGDEGVIREVLEETALEVTDTQFLFSLPNLYRYSDLDIPTLDMFYLCKVKDTSIMQAGDDAAEAMWITLDQIDIEQFGLSSIKKGLSIFLDKVRYKSI